MVKKQVQNIGQTCFQESIQKIRNISKNFGPNFVQHFGPIYDHIGVRGPKGELMKSCLEEIQVFTKVQGYTSDMKKTWTKIGNTRK